MPPRPSRYWAGKAPDWAQTSGEGGSSVNETSAGLPLFATQPVAVQTDARLARLQQKRRDVAEAAVVVQRRHAQLTDDLDRNAARGRQSAPGGDHQERVAEEQDEEDAETLAAWRLAIRARQLAQAAATVGAAGSDKGSDDSSEYTTDDKDESEDECGPALLKPAFVPRTERDTIAERDALLAQAEQSTRQEAEQLEERRRQTQQLVAAQEVLQQEAPIDENEGGLNTDDDEADEVAEYEAWRDRELRRIARDRQLRQAGNQAELAATSSASLAEATTQPKKKWKFLQKYWHKGAFFQSEGNEGEDVLGGIMLRDYDAPTGEDKFDKQLLPKIMQVRQFGRRGRTKWQHLLAEDTTIVAGEHSLPARQPRQLLQQSSFSKPRMHQT